MKRGGGFASFGVIMAGPAKVEFPGDKNRQQQLRVRNVKRASRAVQKRISKSLEALMKHPRDSMPDLDGNIPKRHAIRKSIGKIDTILQHRQDRAWLQKRISSRKFKGIEKAWIGSLVAAHENDFNTVMTFSLPLYGSASYIRRGDGQPAKLVGIQHHGNPILRLLAWEDFAKKGQWFFSWDKGFTCTGSLPNPPNEWVWSIVKSSQINFEYGDNESLSTTKEGEIELSIGNVDVRLGFNDLREGEGAFVRHLAQHMMPPMPGKCISAKIEWKPIGWPTDQDLPLIAQERLEGVIEKWLNLEIDEGDVEELAKNAVLSFIDHGYLVGKRWFDDTNIDGVLNELTGSNGERDLANAVLQDIGKGIHVVAAKTMNFIEHDVVRIEVKTLNDLLSALWDQCNSSVLSDAFGMESELAEGVHAAQVQRGESFGAFLRRIEGVITSHNLAKRFPIDLEKLAEPVRVIHSLALDSIERGIGPTVSAARKVKGGVRIRAAAWAWLVAIERENGQEWTFESDARDLGQGWAQIVSKLREASEDLANATQDEIEKMKKDHLKLLEHVTKATDSKWLDPTFK